MITLPQPWAVIAGSAALVTRNAEVRLRASAACQVARSIASAVPDSNTGLAAEVIPALLTTMSSRPHRSSAAATRPRRSILAGQITDEPRRVEAGRAQLAGPGLDPV